MDHLEVQGTLGTLDLKDLPDHLDPKGFVDHQDIEETKEAKEPLETEDQLALLEDLVSRDQLVLLDPQETKDIEAAADLKDIDIDIVNDVGTLNQFRWTLWDSVMEHLSLREIID